MSTDYTIERLVEFLKVLRDEKGGMVELCLYGDGSGDISLVNGGVMYIWDSLHDLHRILDGEIGLCRFCENIHNVGWAC